MANGNDVWWRRQAAWNVPAGEGVDVLPEPEPLGATITGVEPSPALGRLLQAPVAGVPAQGPSMAAQPVLQAPVAGVPAQGPSMAAQPVNRWGLPEKLFALTQRAPAEQMRLARLLRHPREDSAKAKRLQREFNPPPAREHPQVALERMQQAGRMEERKMMEEGANLRAGLTKEGKIRVQELRGEQRLAQIPAETAGRIAAEIARRETLLQVQGAKSEADLTAQRERLTADYNREMDVQGIKGTQRMEQIVTIGNLTAQELAQKGNVNAAMAAWSAAQTAAYQAWANMPEKDRPGIETVTAGLKMPTFAAPPPVVARPPTVSPEDEAFRRAEMEVETERQGRVGTTTTRNPDVILKNAERTGGDLNRSGQVDPNERNLNRLALVLKRKDLTEADRIRAEQEYDLAYDAVFPYSPQAKKRREQRAAGR